jgi:hypothetical protein
VKTWPRSRIGAELRLVEGDEGEVAVERHRFGGAQEPARVPGQDLLFAGDQRDLAGPLQLDHAIIDFAGEQPQREADHSARMGAHPLDGQMRLAGIGGAENGRQRRPGESAHRE